MPIQNRKQRNKRTVKPKQVAYLFGAGATQAEVDYLGARPVNLLMRDSNVLGEGVSTGILNKIRHRGTRFPGADWGVDIEKAISLLSASGVNRHAELAETMRQYYFREISTRLAESKIGDRPRLAIALLEMHSNQHFQAEVESLSGILTTNHDGLLQTASQAVFAAVNIGIPFTSNDLTAAHGGPVPAILQLHGSFTWQFALPLNVTALRKGSQYSPNTTWIPPAVLKEAKHYPFNKLIGSAYEILAKQCDVLRVIGASLTQNDWNVLSLIFNAQRHSELVNGSAFRIELIMPQRAGATIQDDCSYLKHAATIGDLTEGLFAAYKEQEPLPDPDMSNQFAYWLKAKIDYHRKLHHFGKAALGKMMAEIAGEPT